MKSRRIPGIKSPGKTSVMALRILIKKKTTKRKKIMYTTSTATGEVKGEMTVSSAAA